MCGKFLISISLAFSVAAYAQQKDTFIDSRDGKKYKTVKIGEQVWMAENLNYKIGNSVCYDNKPENCQKYGRLYDWTTAISGICPKGWHIPTNTEWDELYHYVDGTSGTKSPYESKTAGKYLKAKSGWNDYKGNGEDTYGFSALPGGEGPDDKGYLDVNFYGIGDYGSWWSASETGNKYNAYRRYMGYNDGAFWSGIAKLFKYSVRCVEGE